MHKNLDGKVHYGMRYEGGRVTIAWNCKFKCTREASRSKSTPIHFLELGSRMISWFNNRESAIALSSAETRNMPIELTCYKVV